MYKIVQIPQNMRCFIFSSLLPLLILLLVPKKSFSQDTSFVPLTFNYTTHNYNAGNQNWTIAQGSDRVLYFGNEHGLLTFDATNWKLHPLPNNLSVKSVLIDATSSDPERIYVGSFEEFGYFEKNDKNELEYYSLKDLVKDYLLYNDEIWTINKVENNIYFQSFSSYFIYNESAHTIKTIKSFPAPLYFFTADNKLYAQFIDDNFYILNNGEFEILISRDKFNNDNIVSVLPFNNDLFLFTASNGIFSYNIETENLKHIATSLTDKQKKQTVNRVIAISDSSFVIGTLNNGLYALKTDGSLLWELNQNRGLNNNTVLGLFKDKEDNVWTTLDNGIACIQHNSNISIFEPFQHKIGMTEDILVRDNQFYLATNQGIYAYNEKNKEIIHLPGLNVQSWFVRGFDNQIITGNNSGTSFIENNRRIEIPESSTGGTDIKPINIFGKEFLLESTYTAFQIYLKNDQNRWEFSHKVANFFDLINQIEYDHTGNIWASHMYKGIYILRFDEQLKEVEHNEFYSSLDSLQPPSMPIRVMKLRGRIVITDGNYFYTYDDISQNIIKYDQLNTQLQSLADTRKITALNDTTFWFLRTDEHTLVSYISGEYSVVDKISFSILDSPPNRGRGNIFVDNNNVSYFCLNGGMGKYILTNINQSDLPEIGISGLWCYNRKSDSNKALTINKKNIISNIENNVSIQFQYPDYSRKKFTVECLLVDYDTRWINTSADLSVFYSNLPANNYKLNARVMNDKGIEVSSLSILFKVKAPWFKTLPAYLIYFLSFLLLMYILIHTYIRTTVNKRRKIFQQLERDRILQLNKQEKIIAEMRTEKLEDDLTYKSKELANATMLIINQEEILNKLKTEIQEQIRTGKMNRSHGLSLIKMIEQNISDEDEWAVFQENFDLIHENFFTKLKQAYPDLTSGDLRLSALLRLNYTSKEIAKMLNLSIRGVEAARYRLRKKLELNKSENLTLFIMNFK